MPWIAAGGAILGGVLGGLGSKSAAKQQQRAADSATGTQLKMYDEQVERQEPFYAPGVGASNMLANLLGIDTTDGYNQSDYDQRYNELRSAADAKHRGIYGFGLDDAPAWAYSGIREWDKNLQNDAMRYAKEVYKPQARTPEEEAAFGSLLRSFTMDDFQKDPGYEFRMNEGMRGVEGGAAARGGLLSGAALKAIQKYGQDYASNEYGNAYNRFEADKTNKYNSLMGLVKSGQGSAGYMNNAAQNFGQQAGSNMIGAGNAQAAGTMGMTNALVGGINQGINTWQQNQMINQQNERNNLMRLISSPTAGGWGTGNSYGNQDYGSYF